MGSYNKKNVSVVCPYYKGESGVRIVCEGCEDTNTNEKIFRTKADRVAHQKDYCSKINAYRTCPLYRAISRKYGE